MASTGMHDQQAKGAVRQGIRRVLRTRKIRRENTGLLAVLAVVVSLAVAGILMQNGRAMIQEQRVLDCPVAADGSVAHTHNEDCYDAEGRLVCSLPEVELHVHDDSCYTEERTLACGQQEGAGAHTHSDACYDADGNLTCGLEESAGHVHSDACYDVTRTLTCGKDEITEEHVHGPGCFRTVVVDDGADTDSQLEVEGSDAVTDPEGTAEAVEAKGVRTFQHQFVNDKNEVQIKVSVEAPEEALPEGTTMKVEWVDPKAVDQELVQQAIDAQAAAKKDVEPGKLLDLQAVDITFLDAEGNEVEPAQAVTVTLTSALANTKEQAVVVHVESDREARERAEAAGERTYEVEAKALEQLTDKELDKREMALADDQLAFDASQFSTYVIATTTLRHEMKSSDGQTVTVTVDAPAEAGIPQDAVIRVQEIGAGTDQYQDYATRANEAIGVDEANVALARFFDIKIEDAQGQEIQPQAPVNVKIELADAAQIEGDNPEAKVVHFAQDAEDKTQETPEVLGATEKAGTTTFEAAGFSVYGVVYTVDFHYEVDGQVYELSLQGGDAVSLTELLPALGAVEQDKVASFVAGIENVEFSNTSLVAVAHMGEEMTVGALRQQNNLPAEYSSELTEEQIAAMEAKVLQSGDWVLLSLKPFDTEETLTITMKNGEVFTIKVTDAQIKQTVISASGEAYEITVTYDESAQIPDGAELKVREILPEDEKYAEYYAQSLGQAGVLPSMSQEAGANYAHIFDIEIQANGQKVEPKSNVDVSIKLLDVPEDEVELQVVHFGEDGPELMEAEGAGEAVTNEAELSFQTDAFSVYTVVNVDGSTALNGQSFALVSGIAADPGATTGDHFTIIVNAHAVMGVDGVVVIPETPENTSWVQKTKGLAAEGVHAWTGSDGTNYVGGGATQWTFESASNGRYRIYTEENGTKRYITHNGDETSLTTNSGDGTAFTITPTSDGTVLIHDGNRYLRNNAANANGDTDWSRWVNRNYIMTENYFTPTDNEYKFRLCEKSDDFDSFAAQKVSASTITTNANYVIYRKLLDAAGNEELYALAHDGTFVRVYDGGDTIYWREADKNIYWNYRMEDGSPVLFTRNPQTNKTIYLNPNHTTGQTTSETPDGLTLIGKDNGEYTTSIERWDQAAYDYAGLHVTASNGEATLSTGTRVAGTSDHFLFAKASEYPGATKETVATVDSDSLGIKITMFDYGDKDREYAAGYHMPEMTNIVGNDQYTPHEAHALVKPYLESGVPSSKTNGAMTGLFDSGDVIKSSQTDVNHLFLQSYYDESGMFRYRSEDNYAYLGFDTNGNMNKNFTVYRQAATPYTTDTQPGHTYYYHGHYMPFNDIDMNNNLSRLMNQYGNAYENGTAIGELPIEDGRTYEDIYGVQGIPNYFTGMKMEASFSQPKNGKLENGDEMIFKFTGDDDMWVYIDGVLVLDIGGIHEPLSGTINFATGKVTNPMGSSLAGEKTLYQIFQSVLTASGTPQAVKDKINTITWKDVDGNGIPDTFADYSNHSFSAFYMERGAGASNLDLQFNLKVTLTDQFVVEKKLPKDVDLRFVNQKFAFEATFVDTDGLEKPLYPGAIDSGGQEVCTKVVYRNRTDANGDPVPVPFDADHHFVLRAGEAAVFMMSDSSIQYNVKELDIDQYNLEQVEVPGGGTTHHVEINDQQASITDNTAPAGRDEVGDRSAVLYTNYPKMQNLKITKHITRDSALIEPGENPVFEFRVYLESTVTDDQGNVSQKLVPYSYGDYYLVKMVGNELHYFTLDGANNTPNDHGTTKTVCSKTGRSGSINSIPPEYTIVIPNLTAGTNFYLEERRDNIPEPYKFVSEELTPNTYEASSLDLSSDDAIHRVLARDEEDHQVFDPHTVGAIKSGVDAESHVYNRKPKAKIAIGVTKVWRDEDGNDITSDSSKHPGTITYDIYRVKHVHEWDLDNPVIDQQPTDTATGLQRYKCKHEGCTATREEIIPSLGCEMGDWTMTKEPTCTEEGEETRVCKNNASHVETKPINALGHAMSEWTETKAATCTEKGSESRACSRCDHTETREIAALDHDWGEWVVTKEPTTTEEGSETRTCKRDSTHVEIRSIPKQASTIQIGFHLRNQWNKNVPITRGEYQSDGSINVEPGGSIRVTYRTKWLDAGDKYTYSSAVEQLINCTVDQDYVYRYYELLLPVEEGKDLYLYLHNNESSYSDFKIEAIPAPTRSAGPKSLKSARRAAVTPTAVDTVTGYALLDELIAKVGYTDGDGIEHKYYAVEKVYGDESIGTSGWSASYDVESEDESGNAWSYYFVETSPSTGWLTTYSGQDDGLTDGETTTITNQKLPEEHEVTILKTDLDGNPLTGAVFQLTKYDEAHSGYEKFVNDAFDEEGDEGSKVKSGPFTITSTDGVTLKLHPGTYRLVEIHAPDGYILTSNVWEFAVSASGSVTSDDKQIADPSKSIVDSTGGKVTLVIENTPGQALPNAGGSGTQLVTLAGAAMVAAGALYLAASRRRAWADARVAGSRKNGRA